MRRRAIFLRPVLILGAAFLVAALGLLLFARIDRVVVVPGRLAGGTVAAYAPWEGRVARVLVRPGDRVTIGEPLFEMEREPLRAEESRIAARIEILTQHIDALKSDLRRLASELHPAEEKQAARTLERSRLELAGAETRFLMMKQLREQGLATELEFEEAELALKLAGLSLEDATQEAPLLKTKQGAQIDLLTEQIRQAERELVAEQSGLAELRRKLDLGTSAAPAGGVVLGSQLFDLEGRTVEEGQELLRVSAGQADRFEGTVNDNGRALVRPGLRVKIRLEGYPWLIHGSMTGRLDFVADRRGDEPGYFVKISYDSSKAPGPLYEGMKGQARIVVEEKVSLARMLVEKLAGTQGS